MKLFKLFLLLLILFFALLLGWNYADEGVNTLPIQEVEEDLTEDFQYLLEEKIMLVERTFTVVGDKRISEAIVNACTENTDDKVLCIKNLLGVSNAESGMFKAGMTPTNNGFGFMEQGKKKKFSSVEESIIFRVKRYQKKGRRKRTTGADWLKGKYCASACTHRIGNYDAAIRKLGL